jgi:polysaccharide pyruvyl transferase WcaK-like protein
MRIGLFGYYKYGNFGDDLMAALFGRELRSLGIPFKVFGLSTPILKENDFAGVSTIEDLLSGTDIIIYGGGGAFLQSKIKQRATHEQDVGKLCSLCKKQGIPIYMLSVGGSGALSPQPTPSQEILLQQARYITFRNPEDVALISSPNTRYSIGSDIVWRTPLYLSECSINKKKKSMINIGIDVTLLARLESMAFILALVFLIPLSFKKYRFVFYDQFLRSSRENLPRRLLKGVLPVFYKQHQYTTLTSFVASINEADVIITNRLHMGMVAMAYGIPVLQVLPQHKAFVLFKRLRLESFVFTSLRSLPRFLSTFFGRGISEFTSNKLPSSQILQYQENARIHTDTLQNIISGEL